MAIAGSLVSGCDREGGRPSPAESDRTTTAAIVAGYQEMWNAFEEAGKTSDPNGVEFAAGWKVSDLGFGAFGTC